MFAMNRTERLLELLQALRRRKYAVSGATLADELGISIRTLYRDIASLQSQGANIEGEAGVGYIMQPGFMLPPLMFSEIELEALMLGIRWVNKVGDNSLIKAAADVQAKIASVLPISLRDELENTPLRAGPRKIADEELVDLELVRAAMRQELKISITYSDVNNNVSVRVIWPIALGYFEENRILAAWCENRNAFRHFDTSRILTLESVNERYPFHRVELFKQWRALQVD
jgi:predicted DNA-binding transcriptional regulator YafY